MLQSYYANDIFLPMSKHYVVVILEVEKTKEDITLCKTGCINGFGIPQSETINNSLIITNIEITPNAQVDIVDVVTKLKEIIKRG